VSAEAAVASAVLALIALASTPFWRPLPIPLSQIRRLRIRAGTVVGGAMITLGVAGALAWQAPAVTGLALLAVSTLAALTAVAGGGPVASGTLRLADPGKRSQPGPADPDVLRGGAWVGVLERIAIAGSILAGWPEGIALALVVKGLGRYPELRAPAAAERFIIGTFASVLWACGCAAVGLALRR
jgi:hypothetical protein